MAKVLTLNQALKALLFMIAAVLILLFGSQFADQLTRDPNATVYIRWLGVAVAVGVTVPWILLIVWAVSAGDEYVRQVALVGTSFAFLADVLVHIGFNAALDARLIGWNTQLLPIPLALGLWVLGVSIAALYFRYRP
jgi:hypothetical protein